MQRESGDPTVLLIKEYCFNFPQLEEHRTSLVTLASQDLPAILASSLRLDFLSKKFKIGVETLSEMLSRMQELKRPQMQQHKELWKP